MQPSKFNSTSAQEQFLQAKQGAETASLAATNESDIDDLGDDIVDLTAVTQDLSARLLAVEGKYISMDYFEKLDTSYVLPVVPTNLLTGKYLFFGFCKNNLNEPKWTSGIADENGLLNIGATGYFTVTNINSFTPGTIMTDFRLIRIPIDRPTETNKKIKKK